MKTKRTEDYKLPNRRQIRNLLTLARNEQLRASVSSLMDAPHDWDEAMADPAVWMREQGLKLPRGIQAVMTKEISISKPVDPMVIGMPDPDWIPYNIKFSNCRTYWVATRDEEGKIIGYHEETICFGFEIQFNRLPGPFGG